MINTFHKILLKKKIRNDIVGAGSKCGTDETVFRFPVRGNIVEKHHLEDPILNVWIILKRFLK